MDYLAPETLDHGIDGFVEVVPGTQCRPVALRGHMAADGGGYVPENDQWFDVLTETLSGRRVGRDPRRYLSACCANQDTARGTPEPSWPRIGRACR